MSTLQKLFIGQAVVALACLFAAATAHAQMAVVGNWERFDPNSPGGGGNFNSDGWNDLSNSGPPYNVPPPPITDPQYTGTTPPKYSASTTIGVTLGSQSLFLQAAGYQQNLQLKNEWTTGDMAAFNSNRAFAFDVTYPAYTAAQNNDTTVSYQQSQIYSIALNGDGYGFTNQTSAPVYNGTVNFPFNVATPAQTITVRIGYADSLSPTTFQGYAEWIIGTNSNGAGKGQFYFDNVRYYTPGDMNNDGHVNAADIPAMELALTNPTAYQNAYWAGNPNYVDEDRKLIGDMDYAGWTPGSPITQPPALEQVGNGVFDNADLTYLIQYLQAGLGSTSTVPEPGSLVLLGLGGSALLWAVRRRNINSKRM